MVDIFITDSLEKYQQSTFTDKIYYADGFIKQCSFATQASLEEFNSSLLGVEDKACELMLQRFDADTGKFQKDDLNFITNPFINDLLPSGKLHSTLFNFYRFFLVKKYLFQIVIDKFFLYFSIREPKLDVILSEEYYLVQRLPYKFKSAVYYNLFSGRMIKYIARQAYYLGHRLFLQRRKLRKADIAIFIVDQPNEVGLFKKFIDHIKDRQDISLCIIAMNSGNPTDKRVDVSKYAAKNIEVTYLHEHKSALYTDYGPFYDFCESIDPLYSVFRRARLCEIEDIKYGFINHVIPQVKPGVCLYVNNQEEGRIVSNVCKYNGIYSLSIDYAFFFDTYTTERRIGYDIRACISEVTVANWRKHHDPTPKFEVTGFCRLDGWEDRPKDKNGVKRLFDNDQRTILFASTWAPNPNSPLLKEKVQLAEQLSEICHRNKWNLIIKKHPSEFDSSIQGVFDAKQYPNQRIVDHKEMPIFDCIAYADFICTQNSSVFIEALYLNKPFAYLTIYEENVWANMSYFGQEKEVGKFNNISDYENYLIKYADAGSYAHLQAELVFLQRKYLYSVDGKASERLLNLITPIIKK